jgi:hypothetical protein
MTKADWDVEAAIATYNVDAWGSNYFSVNSAGNVEARPLKEAGGSIDLLEVVQEARARGLGFPLVIRFQDLLRHRVETVNRAFQTAMEEFGYRMNAAYCADAAVLDWWLDRLPRLVDKVPPAQGNQLPWIPLARVVTPNYLDDARMQTRMVEYLLARGANPRAGLPYHAGRTVLSLARELNSPALPLLDPPALAAHTVGRTQR